VVKVLVDVCPISLLFVNMASETALSVALLINASVGVMEALLSVAMSDCRAALTMQTSEQVTPLEQGIALRRSPAIISLLLEATVEAVSHLHKHIFSSLSSNPVPGDNTFVKSGFDLYKKDGVFYSSPLCYKWEEGIVSKAINSQPDAQRILDNSLMIISMTGPQLSTTYVGLMLFNIVMAKDFNDNAIKILKMILAKVGTEASMQASELCGGR